MKSENFQYDTRNRLTTSQVTGQGQKVVTYDETGNILTKADAGTYTYNSNNVNQLASVTFVRSGITTNTQIIAYNSQNKVTEMSEGNYSYDVMYGADGDRIRSRLYEDSILSKTKYYAPGYEKIIKSGSTIENHYIVSPYGLEAIIAKTGTSETLYLAETDHLGSLVGLFNTSGIHVEQYSYDAWGRRRNPADLTFINVPVPVITERGFTGHEHLDEFRLINMNGRLYDPLTGRFLNSDPVIDNAGGAQGLNSYTYVLNNPLRYTDPSGYIKTAPPEPGVILNPGWLRYAGYSHHSSSWFLQEFEAGKNGTGADDRVKFEGILYDQETDTYVKGDGTPLSDEEILDYMFSLLEPTNGIEPQGGRGEPDGMVISFSFDFAFGGGLGFEIGLVTDKNGGRQWFASGNANVGYGISAGPNVRTIKSIPGSTFKASDYLGYSAGFSAGLFMIGGFYGGNKSQWNFTDFLDFGDTYIENGLGISKIKAPIFGVWWSDTSTKKLFGR